MSRTLQEHLRGLDAGTTEERWEAAKSLSSLLTDLVSSLLALLKKAEPAETRAAAAYVLGNARHVWARAPLEDVLADRKEEVLVRGHAAEALGYIGLTQSVDVLLKHLHDEHSSVKYWCIFALGQIADPRALPKLEQIAETAGDEFYEGHSLRAEALNAIAEIRERLNAG